MLVVHLLLAVVLKLFLIGTIYLSIQHFYEDKGQRGIVAYLLGYATQIFVMIVLSFFHLLTPWGIAIGIFLICIALLVVKRPVLKRDMSVTLHSRISVEKAIVLGAFLLLFIGLLLRPFFYYDTTDDALVQGMPKLAFMQQHASLFVKYDSFTINTFSNEWLGELNGLYYMLLCGVDRAAGFGNVEIFLFAWFAFLYVARSMGYRGKHIWAVAFFAVTLPVIPALAMTIKTDLSSIVLLPLTVAFLLQYYREQSAGNLFAAIISLGAAAGAKISVLPAAGLLLIALVLFYFLKAKKKPIFPVIAGGAVFALFCSRYLANLVQYRNPFQRALNEKASFSFSNVVRAFSGILSEFNELPEMLRTLKPGSSVNWLVNKGTGYAGYLILICVIAAVCLLLTKRVTVSRTSWLYVGVPCAAGFLFFISSSVWQVWSFRYVAPYVMVGYFASIVIFQYFLAHRKHLSHIIAGMCVCVGILNAVSLFRSGQALPMGPREMLSLPQTQQKMIFASVSKYEDLSQVPGLMDILETGGKGLVFDSFSFPYYQFFGDNHCVEIDLAYNESDLIARFADKEYDFYVIADNLEHLKNYQKALAFFTEKGYSAYDTSNGLIFICA